MYPRKSRMLTTEKQILRWELFSIRKCERQKISKIFNYNRSEDEIGKKKIGKCQSKILFEVICDTQVELKTNTSPEVIYMGL